MPAIKRLATFKPSTNPTDGIVIELTDGRAVKVLQSQLEQLTAEQVQVALRTVTGETALFVHRNLDGSVALAIGAEPEMWPEDEVV